MTHIAPINLITPPKKTVSLTERRSLLYTALILNHSLEIGKNIIYSLSVNTNHILYEEGDNESDTGNKSWKYFYKNSII